MKIFTKVEGIYTKTAEKYKRGREQIRISKPIEFEGNLYRQVVYNPSFLGKIKEETKGIVFITESGDVVEDKRTLRELASLSYYFQNMFDEESKKSIKRALISDEEINKEVKDNELIIKALESLKNENLHGVDMLINIFTNLPETRRQSNSAILEFTNKIKEFDNEDFIFTKQILDSLIIPYRNILIANFNRIKLINRGRAFYDDIKKEASKRNKRFSIGTNNTKDSFVKLENSIEYLKKILRLYEKVLDMSEDQYIKYLDKIDKEKIEANIKLIRN
ncbi:hypothetical protein SAMN05443428_10921 [Caloramator quimbayensis]|uniref:Uncharacterized protein n=1 Tax=Caloramator quimbayensis TaxID=1147123 RepID=A0A1T4XGG1_9CLOT|nr:hypothetical protein [Caloramator quimbayensis]SKA88672.1 hypothetical protein SAMN05443428_10921 [Caloramator quimbayensis]